MSRSSTLSLSLIFLALIACRREPAAGAATPSTTDSTTGHASTTPDTDNHLPEVHHRGWSLFQEVVDASETMVSAWAPGDHLKEAYAVAIPDLYREHYHFAEWSHGSLFAIRRIGDYRTEDWTDELWEYRDGQEPRRIASGQGIDFRLSPDGKHILLVATDSATDAPYRAHILDRSGKVLATRTTAEYGRETFVPLDMGDSIAYLGADIDDDLYRWSLGSDSLVPLARPEEALEDRLVLADRDLLVASDYPPMMDSEEFDAFQKARRPVILRAFHLRDGRKQELARAAGRSFHPVVGENDSIEIATSNPDSTGCIAPPWP